MKWTSKQLEAINHKDENILVSAGAGSGKTAILSARVTRILKEGTHINELLILTFTKAASEEMKERIRQNIIDSELYEELDLIDSSYITTFDSFALSIVKKYHYLLNIDKDIVIMDSSILKIEKERIIKEVLEKYYLNEDDDVINLVSTILRKDDSLLIKGLETLIDKIDLETNSTDFINSCISQDKNERFNLVYTNYLNKIFEYISNIENNLFNMESYIENEKDEKILEKCNDYFSKLINAKSYNEVKCFINEADVLRLGKIANEDINNLKKEITGFYNNIKDLCIYDNEEFIKNKYLESYDLSNTIFELAKEIYEKYSTYKLTNKMYSFMDIAKLAIKIFKENPNIANEIKYSLKEIMIDEYQDTSSIQEEFMSYIANNNMYMVGDIKQSIYRFRHANPDLFKNKYKEYKDYKGGYLIDLNTNFRSRKEVLSNINEIFSEIMQEDIGGANYKKDHLIEFGNKVYEDDGINEDHNLEIYNYNKKDYNGLNAGEIEAFIVANDISNKIKNNYEVLNKKDGKKYCASYNDFVVLVDKRSDFSNYKKIFEYFNIPTLMYENENIVGQVDMDLFKNILIVLNSYKNSCFNKGFKHAFYSLAKSYLFNYKDDEILKIITTSNIYENKIYDCYKDLISRLNILSLKQIFNEIIFVSDWYNKLILKGDAKSSEAKLAYLVDLATNLDKLDYSLDKVIEYFNIIEEKEIDIQIPMSTEEVNAVKFMTIHNSKGLEFPVCYFVGFNNKFNTSDIKETFLLNKNKLIIPFYQDNYRYPNIESFEYKKDYILEEISEKIRLLYVSLTRAKEKMIIVGDFNKLDKKEVDKINSFNNFIININEKMNKYITNVDVNNLKINKDYKKYISNKKLNNNYKEIEYASIPNYKQEKEAMRYSKELNLENKDDTILKLGNKLHNLLFEIDFKNPNFTNVSSNDITTINRFLNSNILDIKNAINIYKEYEFISEDHHGFIDLLIEYNDEYKIIDYKLSNIDDTNYINQLKGYKTYLEKIVNKPINLYLYSLLKGEYKKVD